MAIVKKYPARVIDINNHGNVYTVTFRTLGSRFKFKPGQFLHLALNSYDPSMAWPESRCFSMQSSPGNDIVKITFAVKGEFTTRMGNYLKPGVDVTLKMPYGNLFTQEHTKGNTVFISGGTGITPFLSLFTSTKFNEYKNPILYAGFRSDQDNLFKKDLISANQINPSLEIKYIYENKSGKIDIKKIYDEVDPNATYFISGPPLMIKNFQDFLISKQLNESQILFDDWA